MDRYFPQSLKFELVRFQTQPIYLYLVVNFPCSSIQLLSKYAGGPSDRTIIENKRKKAIRRKFEHVGPTLLKNPLDAMWGLLLALQWVGSCELLMIFIVLGLKWRFLNHQWNTSLPPNLLQQWITCCIISVSKTQIRSCVEPRLFCG